MAEIPADFNEALEKAGLGAFFAECTAPHQGEYLKWLGEAKRPETRAKRIQQALKMLSDKRAEEEARAKRRS